MRHDMCGVFDRRSSLERSKPSIRDIGNCSLRTLSEQLVPDNQAMEDNGPGCEPFLLSIVIPTYLRVDLLKECLRSITVARKALDGRSELIVVDDGSPGGVKDVVAAHDASARVIRLDTNTGFSAAVAQGIDAARGEWVALINDDTRVDPDALVELLAAARSGHRVGSVAAQVRFMSHPETLNSAGIIVDRLGVSEDRLLGASITESEHQPTDVFGTAATAALYRREMLVDVGGFDPTFYAHLEDVDVAWRAQMRGWNCLYAPRAVVYHHHSATLAHFSDQKYFVGGRNRVRLIAKNADRRLLWRHGWAMVLYDLAYVAFVAVRERTLAPLRGRMAGLKGWAIYRRAGSHGRRPVPLASPRGIRGAMRRRAVWSTSTASTGNSVEHSPAGDLLQRGSERSQQDGMHSSPGEQASDPGSPRAAGTVANSPLLRRRRPLLIVLVIGFAVWGLALIDFGTKRTTQSGVLAESTPPGRWAGVSTPSSFLSASDPVTPAGPWAVRKEGDELEISGATPTGENRYRTAYHARVRISGPPQAIDIDRWGRRQLPALFTMRQTNTEIRIEAYRLGPVPTSVFQGAAPLKKTSSERKYLIGTYSGRIPDLFVIDGGHPWVLRIFSGESGFRDLVAQVPLPERLTKLNAWWLDLRARPGAAPDLLLVSRGTATATGNTEVHVLAGADGFQGFTTEAPTSVSDRAKLRPWIYQQHDGRADLLAFAPDKGGVAITVVPLI